MKVIVDETISAITADEEQALYPSSNLLDYNTKRLWKANTHESVITLSVAANTNSVALFNTNATGATVEARDGGGLGCKWSTASPTGTITTFTSSSITWPSLYAPTPVFSQNPSGVGSLWGEYTAIDHAHFIDISLVASSSKTIQAGVVRAGIYREINNPMYGVQESLKDFSIVKELNNGSIYFKKKDIIRTFNFSVTDETSDIWYMIFNIAQYKGPEPLAWKLIGSSTDFEWVVFARFNQMPSMTHISNLFAQADINLIEVV